MINLVNVRKSFGELEVLKDINLQIHEKEIYGIIGQSGAGKSTLLRCINGLETYDSGTITVDGTAVDENDKKQLRQLRKDMGMIFQNFNLLSRLDVYDNVAFAQRVVETPPRYIRRQVPAMLSLVGLVDKYKSYPKQLSGGEQQRVAMARALVNNPAIILADEPTGNLDPTNSWEIMKLLEEINARGTTVVVVTHDREIVNRYKDKNQKMKMNIKNAVLLDNKYFTHSNETFKKEVIAFDFIYEEERDGNI